jgi:HD superfamily phosphodiesterase
MVVCCASCPVTCAPCGTAGWWEIYNPSAALHPPGGRYSRRPRLVHAVDHGPIMPDQNSYGRQGSSPINGGTATLARVSMAALHHALTEPVAPHLRELPPAAADLLIELAAPPRLAAHLRVVHDVACRLTDDIRGAYPALTVDRDLVQLGAATHDIGKTLHPDELSGPGSRHEQAGYELLLAHGFDVRFARFARTHATWTALDVTIEDLLVSLADKVWKAKRVADLEDQIVKRICATSGERPWQAFLALDDVSARIVRDADARLAFQARHPIGSG